MRSKFIYKSTAYLAWYQQVALSFFVAVYMNTFTQYKAWYKLLTQQNYYEAIVFSFIVAFSVIYGIQKLSIYLDRILTWEKETLKRIVFQLLLGVIAILTLIYFCVIAYFKLVGADIYLSDYLVLEFPMVQVMVVVLNMFYACLYFIRKLRLRLNHKDYVIASLGSKTYFIQFSEIAYMIRENRDGVLVTKKDQHYSINFKMNDLEMLLPVDEFFRINRSVIVSLDMVQGFKPAKNSQVALILNISTPSELNLFVTRDRTKVFKELFKNKVNLSKEIKLASA